MEFEYLHQVVVGDTIEIDDIGNCAISAFNDAGEEYYIVVKTSLGWTEIFEFGPIIRDVKELPQNVAMFYSRLEYDARKIAKAIDRFLNAPKRFITQAIEIDIEDAKSKMVNLVDYI